MRQPAIWLMVAIVLGSWLLFFGGYIGIVVTLIASVAGVLIPAWYLDRVGAGRKAASRIDSNAPNFYAPMGNATWQVPTSYIDHPRGGGAPPGVEQSDDEGVARDLEDDRVAPRGSQSDDEAP